MRRRNDCAGQSGMGEQKKVCGSRGLLYERNFGHRVRIRSSAEPKRQHAPTALLASRQPRVYGPSDWLIPRFNAATLLKRDLLTRSSPGLAILRPLTEQFPEANSPTPSELHGQPAPWGAIYHIRCMFALG